MNKLAEGLLGASIFIQHPVLAQVSAGRFIWIKWR